MAEQNIDWASLPPFERSEGFLTSRAHADLPMLAIADEVSDILGKVMQSFILPKVAVKDDDWYQTKALIYLGMIGGRSLRVMMALFTVGYDAEALPFHRRLSEAYARTARIIDPVNGGQRARDWLKGGDTSASSVVELTQDMWKVFSHPAHADYRAAEQHLVKDRGDGMVDFALLPLRNPIMGNATLVMGTTLVRNIAMMIATFKGLTINGLNEFDGRLLAANAEYVSDASREGIEAED